MSSSHRIAIDEHHRLEVSRDSRDGSIHIGLRRHKRGRPSWFTPAEWRSFLAALEAAPVDGLIAKCQAETED